MRDPLPQLQQVGVGILYRVVGWGEFDHGDDVFKIAPSSRSKPLKFYASASRFCVSEIRGRSLVLTQPQGPLILNTITTQFDSSTFLSRSQKLLTPHDVDLIAATMLKNRGKIFAPKAKGIVRRQPSAAPSSARPSVERQSQTPAPRQESVVSVVEEETAAEEPVVERELREQVAEAQAQAESSQSRTPLPDTATFRHPSPDSRKRKAQDESIPEPPAKRIPASIERQDLTQPTTPSQATDHETHEHPTSHDTPTTEGNNLKRKEREEENIERPAKRVSAEVESRPQTTEPEHQPQDEEADARTAFPVSEGPVESSEAVQHIRQSSEPENNDSISEDDDEETQSSREPTFQAPQYQYPDPEGMNIARIVDDIPGARLGSMGPAGGSGSGSGLGAAGDLGAAGRNSQASHLSEIVPRGVLNPDGTSGGIVEEAASGAEGTKKGKRKYTKRKKVQAPEIGDDGRATVEMQLVKPRRQKGQRRTRRKPENKERKQRAATPEGAEEEEIDKETMTMQDLCKDLRIGKPFSMHGEIKARIQKKKLELARIKLRKEHPELIPLMDAEDDAPAGEEGQAGSSGTNAAQSVAPEQEEQEGSAPAGPQMRIIDGQIVIDDRTLQIDRQKRAQALQTEMTEVEENDFTRVVTSGTWMKIERSQAWDAVENTLFYDCLSRHGTDFEMIASYFPHRNRRQIKLKFNKEERNNPARVTRAMTNPHKKPIDLEHYQEMSNTTLEDVAAIEKERAEYDAEQEAEQSKQEAAKAEVTRRKKEAIQATSRAKNILDSVELSDDEDGGPGRATGGESAKENREPAGRSIEAPSAKGKKKAAKPRKNKHSHYAGGDEVEVLGTID